MYYCLLNHGLSVLKGAWLLFIFCGLDGPLSRTIAQFNVPLDDLSSEKDPLASVGYSSLGWLCFLPNFLSDDSNCKVMRVSTSTSDTSSDSPSLCLQRKTRKRWNIFFLACTKASMRCSTSASVMHFCKSACGNRWWKIFCASAYSDKKNRLLALLSVLSHGVLSTCGPLSSMSLHVFYQSVPLFR